MLKQCGAPGDWWQPHDQKKRISLGAYTTVLFKTGEDPDNLYGDDVYAAVMDEYTRQREESWHAIRSTLTATGGPIRMLGNVKGTKNWGYRLARKVQQGDLPSATYHKVTWRDAVDAGIMTEEEVDDARKMLPEQVFRELYEAEPSEDGSNPFGLSHIDACVGPLEDGPAVCYGVDLAKSRDYTVIVGCNETGGVCFFERWQGASWEHTTERLIELIGETPAQIDSTGVGDPIFERIQRACPLAQGVKFTNTSKQQLMEGLAVAIQTGAVRYPEGPIAQELRTFEYVYNRHTVSYSAPDGLHDDCVCALALMVKGRTAVETAPVFSVSVVTNPRMRRLYG